MHQRENQSITEEEYMDEYTDDEIPENLSCSDAELDGEDTISVEEYEGLIENTCEEEPVAHSGTATENLNKEAAKSLEQEQYVSSVLQNVAESLIHIHK